ncbi:MAG: SPOR domain-containing protein, partial [Rhodothermales bacterium]
SQFATTAFGARSRSLIDEIESRASAEADSLISAESDSLNQATSDSLNQATPDSVDVYAAPADSSAHEVSGGEPSQAVFSLRGPDAIDLAAGGWTLLVAEFADEASARSIAEELRDQDFRTLVLEEDGIHTVYVGQFAQQRMAEAALRINRATFPEPAKTVSLTDLADSP